MKTLEELIAGVQPNASPYQRAVYAHVTEKLRLPGRHALLVRAVAGSGKTSCLVALTNIIARDPEISGSLANSAFLAFSKDIVTELSNKLTEVPALGLTVKTMHGLGYGAWAAHTHKALTLDNYKYRGLLIKHAVETDPIRGNTSRAEMVQNKSKIGWRLADEDTDVVDGTEKLLGMAQVWLLTEPILNGGLTEEDLLDQCLALASKYDIVLTNPEWSIKAIRTVLEQGITLGQGVDPWVGAECGCVVSYADMLWLPVQCNVRLRRYNLLMVDECQDLNRLQREFVLRSRAEDCCTILVGDENQAIYGFAGADTDSVQRLIDETQAELLPLDICYRCPKSHIILAQGLVPHIRHRDDAPEGVIQELEHKDILIASVWRKGDMVLCRTCAPLVALALHLIRLGVGAKVKGKDIGAGLAKIVEQVAGTKDSNCFTQGQFLEFLNRWQDIQEQIIRQKAKREEEADLQIASLQDRISCVHVLYGRFYSQSQEKFLARGTKGFRQDIDGLFADSSEAATVMCSSVHKAKGLEADRVFLLEPENIPHRRARTDEQVTQELNLRYVALTRAKKELYLVPAPPKEN